MNPKNCGRGLCLHFATVVTFRGSYYYPIIQTRKMEAKWFKSPACSLTACEMQGDFTQICTGTLIDEHGDTQVRRYMSTRTCAHTEEQL